LADGLVLISLDIEFHLFSCLKQVDFIVFEFREDMEKSTSKVSETVYKTRPHTFFGLNLFDQTRLDSPSTPGHKSIVFLGKELIFLEPILHNCEGGCKVRLILKHVGVDASDSSTERSKLGVANGADKLLHGTPLLWLLMIGIDKNCVYFNGLLAWLQLLLIVASCLHVQAYQVLDVLEFLLGLHSDIINKLILLLILALSVFCLLYKLIIYDGKCYNL